MFKIISRIMLLGNRQTSNKLKAACVVGFFEGIFAKMPIFMLLYLLTRIVDKTIAPQNIRFSIIMIVIGVVGRYILRRTVYSLQSATAYEIFEIERIKIGDKFKRFSMGFFNEKRLGDSLSVITTDFSFIEMFAIPSIDKVVNGVSSVIIGCAFLLYLDCRVAMVSFVVGIVAIFVFKQIQKVGKVQAANKARVHGKLSSVVLEYVQGISVIKAFNMAGDKSKATKEVFKDARDKLIGFEKAVIPLLFRYETVFSFGIAITIFLASYYFAHGTLTLQVLLMLVIFIFQLYIPAIALGVLSMKIRVMEAGLDRYDELRNTPIIDKNGKDIKLNKFDIKFNKVSFAYQDKKVLNNLSFQVPEKSMTALVGASGSGKTTIANLIARFWDVQGGEVLVGGVNVKEMTCDSLLKNISMVFQKVYLFSDTVINNIKVGKPSATFQEIVAAAKKARCHEFITKLDNGYNTIIGEGGSTLSGGEKQRISVARAILKNAPIILLDEATASVDPDNEKHIQMAINELVQNKTLVVIAHRLSTIRSADQILVIDEGQLIEQGTHTELIDANGQYSNFWNRRVRARSWQIDI